MCILCRKKQEILVKSGSWMQSTGNVGFSSSFDLDASPSDPLLGKIHDETHFSSSARNSRASTPSFMGVTTSRGVASAATTPTAASLSNFFSRAMSLATPTTPLAPPFMAPSSHGATPSVTPTGPKGFSMRSSALRGGLQRGASLDQYNPPHQAKSLVAASSTSLNRPLQTSFLIPSASSTTTALPRQRSLESSSYVPPAPTVSATSPLRGSSVPTRRVPFQRRHPLLRGQSEGGVPGIYDPYESNLTTRRYGSHPLSLTSRVTRPVLSSPSSLASLRSIEGRNAYLRKQSSLILESMSAPEDALDLGSLVGSGYNSGAELGADLASASMYPRVLVSDSEARDLCTPLTSTQKDRRRRSLLEPRNLNQGGTGTGPGGGSLTSSFDTSELSPSQGGSGIVGGVGVNPARRTFTRRKLDAAFRNDSLSSDQSECVSRPPPPKPHKRRDEMTMPTASAMPTSIPTASKTRPDLLGGSRRAKLALGSSSEEEVRSTPDYTSCGEEEIESESVSEKGKRIVQGSEIELSNGCVIKSLFSEWR